MALHSPMRRGSCGETVSVMSNATAPRPASRVAFMAEMDIYHALFWACGAVCAVAEYLILRAAFSPVVETAPTVNVPQSPRSIEMLWGVLPAIALSVRCSGRRGERCTDMTLLRRLAYLSVIPGLRADCCWCDRPHHGVGDGVRRSLAHLPRALVPAARSDRLGHRDQPPVHRGGVDGSDSAVIGHRDRAARDPWRRGTGRRVARGGRGSAARHDRGDLWRRDREDGTQSLHHRDTSMHRDDVAGGAGIHGGSRGGVRRGDAAAAECTGWPRSR